VPVVGPHRLRHAVATGLLEFAGSEARRGRDDAQTPRLVVLERLQLLAGVHHEGAVGGDWVTDQHPPRIRVTIAAIVLLWLE
jgi:hypothetical protein